MNAPLRLPLLVWPFLAVLVASLAFLLLPAMAATRAYGPLGLLGAGEKQSACEGGPCAEMVEMEVRDVVPLEEAATHAVVLVTKDRELVLPIFVDEGSAVAIAFRLAHRTSPHPQAQDLADSMMTGLGGKLTEVRIDNVEDAVFTGRVMVTQGEKHLEFPARPSDSIALALTHGVKIFASRQVLTHAGLSQEDIDRLKQYHGTPPAPDEGPGVGGSGPPEELDAVPPPPEGAGELSPPGKGEPIQL